jgi:hypothetical protein
MWRFFQPQAVPSRGKLERRRSGGAPALPLSIKA